MNSADMDSDDSGEIVIVPPQDLVSQIAVQKTHTAPEHHEEDHEDMLHDVKPLPGCCDRVLQCLSCIGEKIL